MKTVNLSSALGNISGSNADALITWASTINKNGYTPVNGMISGNTLIEGAETEVRAQIYEAVKNLNEQKKQEIIAGLQQIINISNTLIATAVNNQHTISAIYQAYNTEEIIQQNNLISVWERTSNALFNNKLQVSLSVGYNAGDGGNIQIGYGEVEGDYVKYVNSLAVNVNQLVTNIKDTSLAQKTPDETKLVFQQHYNGLLNSINSPRTPQEIQAAYIWLWYYRKTEYDKVHSRENSSYRDIFLSSKNGDTGKAFEAFMSHMFTYHKLAYENESLNMDTSSIEGSVEVEEGIPNFFHTLFDSQNNVTPWYSSGDIVMLDENGNIKINNQSKSVLRGNTYKHEIKYKEIGKLCSTLLAIVQDSSVQISDQMCRKLITTVLKPSGEKISAEIQRTVDKLLAGLGA